MWRIGNHTNKMELKKILIIGKQGVGKTRFAEAISRSFAIPVFDEVSGLNELGNKEGVYVSNAIPVEVAQAGLPKGFILVHVS